MLTCFEKNPIEQSIPLYVILTTEFSQWLEQQDAVVINWLKTTNFRADNGGVSFIPDASGKLARVIFCMSDPKNIFTVGSLPVLLPEGVYSFESTNPIHHEHYAIAWGLGAYQ